MARNGELAVEQPKASAWHVAVLVIAGLGAYANAIPNEFVYDDHKLIELVLSLREEGRLCVIEEDETERDPKLICSMGLV